MTTSTLPFPAADLTRLVRDEHPVVRSVAAHRLADAFDTNVESDLCQLLWEIAGTDCYEALRHVVPLLADDRPRIRRFALLAVKGLHPLSGLPSRPGLAKETSRPATYLTEWLEPRSHFRDALVSTVRERTEAADELAETLAQLQGERASISSTLAEVDDRLATRYLRAHEANARERAPVQLIVALTYRCDRKCPYCYAYESQASYTADIDLEAAMRCLDWAVEQRADLISFTGGEPTCHPHFDALVRAVGERGMRLYLNSNGLFDAAIGKSLERDFVLNVGLHLSERRLHRKGEIEKIRANAQSLLQGGVDVFVRHTLWRSSADDVEWVVEFCRELGIRHLNLALGFPGRTATNRYLPSEALLDTKPIYFKALDLAARSGIRVRTSKPVPLCLFTPAEFAQHQRFHELASTCTIHERGGVHNLVVNPDLSVYPCVGLPFAGPSLFDGPGYEQKSDHCSTHVRRALAVVQSACDGCPVGNAGACQASCLGHCNASDASGIEGAEAVA